VTADIPGRGHNGRFVRVPDTAERDGQAAAQRAQGASYGTIAVSLGYADSSGAYKAVSRALAAHTAEPAAEVVALELARLDDLQERAHRVLDADHVTVQHGHVVELNGRPLTDHGPVLAAVSTLLKIAERRARLLGLDAPTKVDAVVETVSPVDIELRGLIEQQRAKNAAMLAELRAEGRADG
jgi:hypothetical protein